MNGLLTISIITKLGTIIISILMGHIIILYKISSILAHMINSNRFLKELVLTVLNLLMIELAIRTSLVSSLGYLSVYPLLIIFLQ